MASIKNFFLKQKLKKIAVNTWLPPKIKETFITKYRYLKYSYQQRNIDKILSLKDLHQNKRAFIIGMGPSLRVQDLDKLKNEITFACNKIFLAFDETEWRPTYYSVSDSLVAKNNFKIINSLDLVSIHRDNASRYLSPKQDTIWLRDLKKFKEKPFFIDQLDVGVFRGGTVLYMQIQVAIWMGIREIYIIGADYSFDVPKGTGELSEVGEIVINEDQQNHFHPDYRKKGESWAKPNLQMQFDAFKLAKEYATQNGIKIFNASRQTKLEVFERVDFDSLNLQ